MTHLYKVLGYSGAIPFICAALGIFLFKTLAYWFLAFLILYAGLIASFLGGVHWSHALVRKSEGQMLLAMLPALLSLLLSGWGLVLISGGLAVLIFGKVLLCAVLGIYILLYFTLLVMDGQWLDKNLLPDGYMRMRTGITLIVVFCLLASMAFLWI